MCGFPHAAIVSARWSSANRSRMFGLDGPRPRAWGPPRPRLAPTRTEMVNARADGASRGNVTRINDPPP